MTLESLMKEAVKALKQRNVEDPSKEAGLLLSRVLGKDLSFVYAHSDLTPDDEIVKKYKKVIERRGQQEPYAYITGEREFLSLSFDVNPSVLIPRPDTELLAEAALAALGIAPDLFTQFMFPLPKMDTVHILDIGTGSGCLAVSIAKYAALSKIDVIVDAVDISPDALKTAAHNAEKHKVSDRVRFIETDFLTDSSLLMRKYDLVISNPPYIPSGDIPKLMPSVTEYEPHSALDGGTDGFVFYRALAEKATSLLAPHGILAVECGFDQAQKVRELFSEKKMETLLLKDLAGIDRVIAAKF